MFRGYHSGLAEVSSHFGMLRSVNWKVATAISKNLGVFETSVAMSPTSTCQSTRLKMPKDFNIRITNASKVKR